MSDEGSTIPIERLNQEIAKRREAEAKAADIGSKLDALKGKATVWQAKAEQSEETARQMNAIQSEMERAADRHRSVVSLLESGVRDSSVREFLLHGFEKQAAQDGGKPWDAWWMEQQETPSAVLAPFVNGSAPAVEPDAPQSAEDGRESAIDSPPTSVAPSAPAAPRVNGGARPSPTPGRYGAGDYARMAGNNPQQFLQRLRAGEFN